VSETQLRGMTILKTTAKEFCSMGGHLTGSGPFNGAKCTRARTGPDCVAPLCIGTNEAGCICLPKLVALLLLQEPPFVPKLSLLLPLHSSLLSFDRIRAGFVFLTGVPARLFVRNHFS
jgi:hypothetical protein